MSRCATRMMGGFGGVGAAIAVAALLLAVVCCAAAVSAATSAARSRPDAPSDWSAQPGAASASARPWRGEAKLGGGNNKVQSASASLRSASADTPLRTFRAARVGAPHVAATSDLPPPSILVPPAAQMDDEGEVDTTAMDAALGDDDDELSWDAAAAGGSTGNSGGRPSYHTPMQFDTIRDSMLNSKWMDDTKQSSSNSMAFLRNFPRRKMDGSSGTNQLQRLGGPFNRTARNAAESDPIGDYLASMFFMYGVPLFFAMLAIVVWAGFCVARCWCNLCGRHATVLYTDKQVRINYVLVVLLIVIMGVCAAFGWTGNVQVSQGLDRGFEAADLLANHGYRLMGVASTAYAIADNALRLGTSFNQTMELVPAPGLLNDSALCVDDTHLALESQGDLVASLRTTSAAVVGSELDVAALQQSAASVARVQAAMDRLAAPVPAETPVPAGGTAGQSALQNMDQQLRALNESLSSLPDAATVEAIIADLAQVQGWSDAAHTLVALRALADGFGGLDSAAAALAPGLSTLVSEGLARLDEGVAALDALPTAITLSSSSSVDDAEALAASYHSLLRAFNTTMPQDFPTLLHRFDTMRDNATALNATLPLVRASLASYRNATQTPWPAAASDAVYVSLGAELGRFEAFQRGQGRALVSVLAADLPALITHLAAMRRAIPAALASFNATQTHLDAVRADPVSSAPGTAPAALAAAVRAFNETSGRVECFLDVLALLADTNATLVILPIGVTEVHDRVQAPLAAQVASLERIRASVALAGAEWDAVNATLGADGAPDFGALAAALTGLNATLSADGLADFEALWAELLPLSQALQAVTAADGVEVAWAAPVWSVQPGDENATVSYPTAQWGAVESVAPRLAPTPAGFVSALSGLVDLPDALKMTSPLARLEALLDDLEAQLGGGGLSATLLERHAQSLASFAEAAATLPPQLRAALPLTSTLPLPPESQASLLGALGTLSDAVAARPPVAPLQSLLGPSAGGLNASLASGAALTDRAEISLALLGFQAGLEALPTLAPALRRLQSNATAAGAFPTLEAVLTTPPQLLALQTALDASAPGAPLAGFPAHNAKLQSMRWGFNLTGVSSLVAELDPALASGGAVATPSLSPAERDVLQATLVLFHDFASHFPDFSARIDQGRAGLDAIYGALEYMEETKQLYKTKHKDFKGTIDNYDGVRLVIFNLGVIFPFVLSFFLLLAAVQHYGCPAMVAGLTFFPLFVLFMCMSAIQMPVSVALSDHCYNSTGEIKIQTEGRVSSLCTAHSPRFFHRTLAARRSRGNGRCVRAHMRIVESH